MPYWTQTSKEEARSIGLTEWSVWCDIRDDDGRTVGSVYGKDSVEENEAIAKRIALTLNAHDELVKALEWAMKQIPPYTKRIPRQNEAWCDGYDAAVAALSKAKAS